MTNNFICVKVVYIQYVGVYDIMCIVLDYIFILCYFDVFVFAFTFSLFSTITQELRLLSAGLISLCLR